MGRLAAIVEPLMNWYEEDHRDLPWRKDRNPYYIWISEIMLQQTRVEAVKPYFQRFIMELPGIEEVARCQEERLLKLWEGLGYYNRVRNIQKAAQKILDEYDGNMPTSYEKLLDLPGIGDYTAGAIGSIAFDQAVPAVDGNVLRVIARVLASREDILKEKTKRMVRSALAEIMPERGSGIFNQSLMELGARVCLPNREPRCDGCPIRKLCGAREEGIAAELPIRIKKVKRKVQERTILVIRDGNLTALQKRPGKGLLAGLYEPVNLEGYLTEDEIIEKVKNMGLLPVQIKKLDEARHVFSHVEWRMKGWLVRIAEQDEEIAGLIFEDLKADGDKFALPTAFMAFKAAMDFRYDRDKVSKETD